MFNITFCIHSNSTNSLLQTVKSFLFCVGRRRVVIKEVKTPPFEKWEPTLVIANPKSGSNEGVKLLRAFRLLLNPAQVCSLLIRLSSSFVLINMYYGVEDFTGLLQSGNVRGEIEK